VVHFVLSDADFAEKSNLLDFLYLETQTRIYESRIYGWNENIVYTAEGMRRSRFLRIVFSVEDESTDFARKVTADLVQFGALKKKDVFSLNFQSISFGEDFPAFRDTMAWMLGCECCTQRYLETFRHRISPFRVNLFHLLKLAIQLPVLRIQLYRAFLEFIYSFKIFSFPTFLSKDVSPIRSHLINSPKKLAASPLDEVFFVCSFFDATLLEGYLFCNFNLFSFCFFLFFFFKKIFLFSFCFFCFLFLF
jgi:hypothetical protein